MAESGTSYKERMGRPWNAQRKKPEIFGLSGLTVGCTKEMTGKYGGPSWTKLIDFGNG